ncbi:MAG: hypothetical protein WA777_01740 [Rhodanobacter sp.]
MLFYEAAARIEKRRRRHALIDGVAITAGGKAATDQFKQLSD